MSPINGALPHGAQSIIVRNQSPILRDGLSGMSEGTLYLADSAGTQFSFIRKTSTSSILCVGTNRMPDTRKTPVRCKRAKRSRHPAYRRQSRLGPSGARLDHRESPGITRCRLMVWHLVWDQEQREFDSPHLDHSDMA